MSGFAGVVSLDGAPPDDNLLKKMAERLAFRGPDGTHIKKQAGVGFVFTFLRTGPAPQCPSQPCSLDGKVWLIGDVRLDGRDELRLKLEQHGEELEPNVTDEELVLRVWRRWGEQGLPELLGDYAFALWDAESRQLWCVRDLMGARPFFYAHIADRFYFSNTLNALRSASDISSELDLHFIGDFLLQGWCPDLTRTAFRDASRLRPGHVLSQSEGKQTIQRFAFLNVEEPLQFKREQDCVEQFRELLEQAVLERLPDGAAAIFMSGGLDSTSVAALAREGAKRSKTSLNLRAYTVDCEPVMPDHEGALASLVAQKLGIDIELQQGASRLPFQGLSNGSLKMPEPFDDPYRDLYAEQVSAIAKHARVALNGYGGDGIMTGQAWPYLMDLARGARLLTIAKSVGRYIYRSKRLPPLRAGFRSKFRRILRPRHEMSGYPRWLAEDFEIRMDLANRWRQMFRPADVSHPWYPRAHNGLEAGLWASVLESEDAGWTFSAVQSRAPLLDMRIHRFLLRVPPIPLCIDKALLRKAVHGKLPDEVRLRAKAPSKGDLLEHQISNNNWRALPLPHPNQTVLRFVDWNRLDHSIRGARGGSLWRDLRPLCLLYWLRAVERQPVSP